MSAVCAEDQAILKSHSKHTDPFGRCEETRIYGLFGLHHGCLKRNRQTDHWVLVASRIWHASHGVLLQRQLSDATFYKWRAKCFVMQASGAGMRCEFEPENAKPKKLLAEAPPDIHALKGVLGVNRWPHRSSASRSA